jgi:hypothetical protein
MRATRVALRTVAAVPAVLLVLALGGSAVALAAVPNITIGHTFSGSLTNQQTPTFTGMTNDILDTVTLKIYAGANATGSPLQSATVMPVPVRLLPLPSEATWTVALGTALKSGQYTALAEQASSFMHTGKSATVTFTVDVTPPPVVIAAPAANAILTVSRPTFSGTAGQAKGDRQSVALAIYSGSSVSGSPVAPALDVTPVGGAWTTGSAGPQLADGIYTAQVSQSDELGNVGTSTVTFAISAPVASGSSQASPAAALTATSSSTTLSPSSPSAPTASFQWFPANPRTGERVVVASTSTDPDSAITGFAWDLAGAGTFSAAGSALSTSFAAPGAHVVRLRVTDAHGLSSVASRTIAVSAAPPKLMAPFPVVRIADTVTALRVQVSLLSVQAPVGATVTVTCRGSGCPAAARDEVATSTRTRHRAGGVVLIVFRRFDRALRAGASLQIRVSEPGQIGKYTRFSIRRAKLPVRMDTCLSPTGTAPIVCPV